MKWVVADSTPLIALSMIGQVDLLRQLFGALMIPTAVHAEVTVAGQGRPGSREAQDAVESGWMTVTPVVRDTFLAALAVQEDAELLILDDRKARARAQRMGLRLTGTVGVLLLARKRGLVSAIAPMLTDLRRSGFRIDGSLLDQLTSQE